ncbi:amidohydrolase family protein [Fodinicola acaciae]|uniref:amidohydrolase family protein n=1 Tax=Fodinicola acaciae TaxID=2681555 RepID=UPI0013D72410|nr:amidohydrolase family protein [Fodinicola acaciae]
MTLLLRNADVDGCFRADVRISGRRVVEVGTALAHQTGEEMFDCRGGAVLPGLCDHHLHLHAIAARATSVVCGPPEVTDRAGLAAALAGATTDAYGWIRGVGYVESVAGPLDAAALDDLRSDVPVRVQHRSGALWLLNTAALTAIGTEQADGRLWRADRWLRSRLPASDPPDLGEVGTRLLRAGITAVTDATPDLDPTAIDAITGAMASGALAGRVCLLGVPIGVSLSGSGPMAGPYKIVLADSGLPAHDDLVERIRAAHAAGRPVAAHCVTREALVLLVSALDAAGALPGDRIEHAALVPEQLIGDLVRLGVRVVTQPGFLHDRGDDFLRDVADHLDLYRCASLIGAGVPVALSSDAPYGPLDPWSIMEVAVSRRTASGQVAGQSERLGFRQALDAYLAPPEDPGGPARRVRPGAAADLIVLHGPLAEAPGYSDPVRAVVLDGNLQPV